MSLEIENKVELEGLYRIEVLRKDGSVKSDTGFFKNLITDYGMNALGGTGGETYGFCRVGTSQTAPSFTDLSLGAQVASAARSAMTTNSGVNQANRYAWRRNVWTFAEGAATGNLAEVGTGSTASGNTLFSRALILDGSGNPTTITVLSDEILRVTWEHRRYWSESDTSGTVTNSGNKGGSFTWTGRAALVSSWITPEWAGSFVFSLTTSSGATARYSYYGTVDLGPITANPTGTQVLAANSATELTYVQDSFKKSVRLSYGLTQGINAAGPMGGLKYSFGGTIWQLVFTPGILKTNEELLELVVSVTWARRP